MRKWLILARFVALLALFYVSYACVAKIQDEAAVARNDRDVLLAMMNGAVTSTTDDNGVKTFSRVTVHETTPGLVIGKL